MFHYKASRNGGTPITGWCFGTCLIFPFSWEWKNHPNWRTHICQLGSYTTNQMTMVFPPFSARFLRAGKELQLRSWPAWTAHGPDSPECPEHAATLLSQAGGWCVWRLHGKLSFAVEGYHLCSKNHRKALEISFFHLFSNGKSRRYCREVGSFWQRWGIPGLKIQCLSIGQPWYMGCTLLETADLTHWHWWDMEPHIAQKRTALARAADLYSSQGFWWWSWSKIEELPGNCLGETYRRYVGFEYRNYTWSCTHMQAI